MLYKGLIILAEIKHYMHQWKVRGLIQNVTHHQTVIVLLGLLKKLRKCLLWASALSMSELHTLVPVFNVRASILFVLFSLVYDQKHFGFSTRLLPMILLI